MTGHGEELPEWWTANQRTKASLGLPPHVPPRFEDGTYTHEVVEPLEAEHGCEILFIGLNVRHQDDWTVRIDGEAAFDVERYRDENGNTVYRLPSTDFRERVEGVLSSQTAR